jgi:hypothetical protein
MIKEYILCAAIWYKDFPLQKDDFPNGFCRPLNCDRGIVFAGHRHHNCLYQMVAVTGKAQHEMGEEVQGFLTNKNRFVTREEAVKIAVEAGQIEKPEYHDDKLFSEDLY